MSGKTLSLVCLAVGCVFAAPIAGGTLGFVLALGALGFGAWAALTATLAKRRDRYSLEALRDLHEQGGPPPLDESEEVAADAGIVCPHCGTVYAAWIRACPGCGR